MSSRQNARLRTNDKIQSFDTAMTNFKQRVLQQSKDKLNQTRQALIEQRRSSRRILSNANENDQDVTQDGEEDIILDDSALHALVKESIFTTLNNRTTPPNSTHSFQQPVQSEKKSLYVKRPSKRQSQQTTTTNTIKSNTTIDEMFDRVFSQVQQETGFQDKLEQWLNESSYEFYVVNQDVTEITIPQEYCHDDNDNIANNNRLLNVPLTPLLKTPTHHPIPPTRYRHDDNNQYTTRGTNNNIMSIDECWEDDEDDNAFMTGMYYDDEINEALQRKEEEHLKILTQCCVQYDQLFKQYPNITVNTPQIIDPNTNPSLDPANLKTIMNNKIFSRVDEGKSTIFQVGNNNNNPQTRKQMDQAQNITFHDLKVQPFAQWFMGLFEDHNNVSYGSNDSDANNNNNNNTSPYLKSLTSEMKQSILQQIGHTGPIASLPSPNATISCPLCCLNSQIVTTTIKAAVTQHNNSQEQSQLSKTFDMIVFSTLCACGCYMVCLKATFLINRLFNAISQNPTINNNQYNIQRYTQYMAALYYLSRELHESSDKSQIDHVEYSNRNGIVHNSRQLLNTIQQPVFFLTFLGTLGGLDAKVRRDEEEAQKQHNTHTLFQCNPNENMVYVDIFYNIVSFLQAAWYHITINQHITNTQQDQNNSQVNNSNHNVHNNFTFNNNINQQQQQQAPNLRPTPSQLLQNNITTTEVPTIQINIPKYIQSLHENAKWFYNSKQNNRNVLFQTMPILPFFVGCSCTECQFTTTIEF